jgi:hypothetical protein
MPCHEAHPATREPARPCRGDGVHDKKYGGWWQTWLSGSGRHTAWLDAAYSKLTADPVKVPFVSFFVPHVAPPV